MVENATPGVSGSRVPSRIQCFTLIWKNVLVVRNHEKFFQLL